MSGAEADGWRIRVARPSLPPLERYVEMLEGVWERGTLTNDGPAARELEKEFAAYGRLDRVLAASSGDVALTLALAALELPRGTEAVLPSFGYPSTVNAIEWNGLTPRFVDVDPDDWCLHAEQLDRDGISRHRGLNAKLSELHAGLGLLSLAGLDEQLVRRRALIATYRSALEHRAEVRFQHTPAGATPTPGFAVAHLGEHRDIVRAALAAEGIESRLYFPALHWMPRLAAVPHAPLPVTERLDRGLLALPLYAELEPSAVEGICAVVCRALEEPHTVDGK
jgi:dTDP-4-amino-4,6-dideoxygalactose transaminase